ncbi:hypothetical protein ET445_03690 [Agromyces protaetiae]|uniref:Uncharacterized protein n=1 Tax=Agromyces protaetiae TaxID=2509455 RepID=A0A4V0YGW0_9MICO|nr:hypothetical protein [Agromyces protaetiae]QAY72581.1 hypothetical protein ET445_03690 [Agromyces protaetiae]
MNDDKIWYSIGSAWLGHGFPDDNLPLLRRVTNSIAIDHYVKRPGRNYVEAVRKDGGKPLKIYYGYTTGFASEQDVLDSAGDVHRWPTSKTGRSWGITHPVNNIRD